MGAELGPQFLYHGTANPVHGDKILPAKKHGGPSYWESTGDVRGEPANEHAWAHPNESKTWEMAMDRVNYHYAQPGETVGRRARVYAVHPNNEQSPGNDKSIPGEVKAPQFDIAHPIDIQPGHQGTFPEINWNQHALGGGSRLPGDEDANHPSHLSVQFGHRAGVKGVSWQGDKYVDDPGRVHEHLTFEAQKEDDNRYVDRLDSRGTGRKHVPRVLSEDQPLPIHVKGRFG